MSYAVCIQCGADKRRPFDACPRCDYRPEGDFEAMARSLVLSSKGVHHTSGRPFLSETAIRAKQADLQRGRPVRFNARLIARLVREQELLAESNTGLHRVAAALFLIFWPALALIAGMFGLLFVVKHLSGPHP